MKRGAKLFTWELLKRKLGIDKVYLTQFRADGIMFHEYDSKYEHAEGAANMIITENNTINFKEELECAIDGDNLCINRSDFINLAESPAVFIQLTDEQIKEIKKLL